MDPWSKVDYSRHIWEASMVMEGLPEVNPPSGRVPGQRLLAAPILKRRWRRNVEEIRKKGSLPRVSTMGAKFRRKGQPGGHQGPRHPLGAAPPLDAPPGRLGPWWVPSVSLLVLREASSALIFYTIFREFIGHYRYRENLKYKNSRKQELALRCTELMVSPNMIKSVSKFI